MKMYQYPTNTGHTIVSPLNLSYAYNESLVVDISRVSASDLRRCSILSNPDLADIVAELADSKQWRTPTEVLKCPALAETAPVMHKCLIQDGTIYIRDGRRYLKLSDAIKRSTKEELGILLQMVAHQAAICQAALAGIELSAMCNSSIDEAV